MHHNEETLSWGWLDFIAVYLGLLLLVMLFSTFGERLPGFLAAIGQPDTRLNRFILSYFIQFVVTLGLVFVFARGLHGASFREMGLRLVSGRSMFRYGILGGLLIVVVIMLLSYPVQILQPDLAPQAYAEMLNAARGTGQLLVVMIMGIVMAPLSEELLYRGMLYPVARGTLGPLGGAVLAGILFGAAHWDLWRTIPLAAGGIILCLIYEKTRSVYVTTVAHGVWNGVMTLILYLGLNYY